MADRSQTIQKDKTLREKDERAVRSFSSGKQVVQKAPAEKEDRKANDPGA